MNNYLLNFETKIEKYSVQYAPYTNVIGLSRSLLAFGTLLTLLVNPVHNFINITTDEKILNPLLNPLAPINKYNFFLLLGFENIWIMKWIAVFLLAMVIYGRFLKVTGFFHWWVSISFLLFSSVIDGGDQIAAILSLLLIPILFTDPRKNHWSKVTIRESPQNIIAVFSIWIIRLQVAIIYLHAGVGKMFVSEWANGTALYYWLNHSVFGMPDWIEPITNPLLENSIIVTILTYGVIIFELALFLALTAVTKYRKKILLAAILFHLLIIVYHGIFSFFFSITTGLILYLYPTYETINIRLWYQKVLKPHFS